MRDICRAAFVDWVVDLLDGLVSLSTILTEQAKNIESINTLRRAMALAPNSGLVWDGLGYVSHYAGLDVEAENAYRRSMELDPTTTRIHWMHGRMLLYVGRAAEAEQEMKKAVSEHPNQYKALAFLGEFLYYQGKMDEAEAVLKKAEELGRSSVDIPANHGQGSTALGRVQTNIGAGNPGNKRIGVVPGYPKEGENASCQAGVAGYRDFPHQEL